MNPAQVRIFPVSGHLLLNLFRGEHRYKIVENALPDDAVIIDCQNSHVVPDSFEILVWSSTFEPVKEGERIPILPIIKAEGLK